MTEKQKKKEEFDKKYYKAHAEFCKRSKKGARKGIGVVSRTNKCVD